MLLSYKSWDSESSKGAEPVKIPYSLYQAQHSNALISTLWDSGEQVGPDVGLISKCHGNIAAAAV